MTPEAAAAPGASPRLLVTGGAGFVMGNVVLEWLTENRTGFCVVFDRVQAWDEIVQRELAAFLAEGRLVFFNGDVTSTPSWSKLAAEHGAFTHVVAGAAVTPTPEEEASGLLRILDVNFMGGARCLDYSHQYCPPSVRVVVVSSDAVLGVSGLLLGESGDVGNATLPPMSTYALSKVGLEATARRMRDLYGMSVAVVRFSDVYGRLDRDTGARNRHNSPYWMCRKALAHAAHRTGQAAPPALLVAGGSLDDRCWDIVDAPSVARAICRMLGSDQPPQQLVYHIALGYAPNHAEVISALEAAVETTLPVRFVAPTDDPYAAVKGLFDVQSLDSNHWLLTSPMDITPLAEEFGWQPMALPSAISEYVTWLQR